VAHVGAAYPENDIFSDVGGVIGYALQVAGDEQRIEGLTGDFGPIIHRLNEADEGFVFHAVDHVIHFKDGLGEFSFAFDERFERTPDHGGDGCGHARDIDRKIGFRQLDHIHDTLSDVYGLISDSLEVGVDLGDGEDEAQIDSHGLLHGEKVEGELIDFAFDLIDLGFALEHHLATREIALNVGLAGAVDRLLGEATHAEQAIAKFVETLLETSTHYPNLPVM
jgi:hypothetical protein